MRRGMGRWEEEDSLHIVYLQLYQELIAYPCLLYAIKAYHPEISENLCLHLRFDIQGPVSSGLFLESCSYPSLGLCLDPQQFPSLSLETETDFWESRSRKLRLTSKSLGLGLEQQGNKGTKALILQLPYIREF